MNRELRLAILARNLDAIRAAVAGGANINGIWPHQSGATVLGYAASASDTPSSVIRTLLELGADPNESSEPRDAPLVRVMRVEGLSVKALLLFVAKPPKNTILDEAVRTIEGMIRIKQIQRKPTQPFEEAVAFLSATKMDRERMIYEIVEREKGRRDADEASLLYIINKMAFDNRRHALAVFGRRFTHRSRSRSSSHRRRSGTRRTSSSHRGGRRRV